MPAPRYQRLPRERQAEILAVARRHFARDGAEGASYNKLIADAGISKTTAYLYFDGKDDLLAEVRRDLHARLAAVLGTWDEAAHADAFWAQLATASEALVRHLQSHPDDLALLQQPHQAPPELAPERWFDALLTNGCALGVIRREVPRLLLRSATMALFRALDEWALASLGRGEPVSFEGAWALLRGLWGSPAEET